MQINVKHLTLCSLVTVSWLPVRPQNWPCCCSWRLISVSNSILRNALASSCCAVVSLSSNVFTFPCSSSSRSMPPVTLFSKSLTAAWESSQQHFVGYVSIIVPNVHIHRIRGRPQHHKKHLCWKCRPKILVIFHRGRRVSEGNVKLKITFSWTIYFLLLA